MIYSHVMIIPRNLFFAIRPLLPANIRASEYERVCLPCLGWRNADAAAECVVPRAGAHGPGPAGAAHGLLHERPRVQPGCRPPAALADLASGRLRRPLTQDWLHCRHGASTAYKCKEKNLFLKVCIHRYFYVCTYKSNS